MNQTRRILSAWNYDPVGPFLRSEPALLRDWATRSQTWILSFCVLMILVGTGLYGAAMGSWRAPLQALYTGIKLPMAILLTTLSNGLLNGMLAPLLGFNASFRQSLVIVLLSFAIASVILAALSPVAFFLVWNTPPLSGGTHLFSPEYGFLQLALVLFVAFAGCVGNIRLVPLLREWTGSARIARRVLLAWLAGNLFLGSQICWLLRPFIWDPAGPVRFIGREYLRGSFYETVFNAARRLIFG